MVLVFIMTITSGRLGIVQSEVEAVLALLWREQYDKVTVAKKHLNLNLLFIFIGHSKQNYQFHSEQNYQIHFHRPHHYNQQNWLNN